MTRIPFVRSFCFIL